MPELEKQETQDEFGWENLTNTDDGRRDMGEPIPAAEPEPQVEGQAAETEPVQKETPVVATDGAVDQQALQEASPEDVVFTLPGGRKVTKAELVADEKLLANLVTHSNQLTHFQRLSEERKAQAEQLEQQNRAILDQYTQWQMQQQAREQMQQQAQQPAPQRPSAQVLESAFAPHLDQMVKDGRLTQDHRLEFGPLIAEYIYDYQNLTNMVGQVIQAGQQEFASIQNRLQGEVVPSVEQFRVQQAQSFDHQVQQAVATIQGYEVLSDPNEWNRLKLFIAEKVNASPRLPDGRPSFDPQFDPETMAQLYDAMTGSEIRQQLAVEKARQQQTAKQTTAMTGGETSARAGTPVVRKPGKLSPEDEALDFGQPNMMGG